MGGFCDSKRDKCAHYHRTSVRPVERLCSPGKADSFIPIQIDYTPKSAKHKETA
jgi:hypothetical protein